MQEFLAKNIRNIAVIGHSGEGKTTFCEAVLFNAGATTRMGKTDDGNTVMDHDAEEIARRISIGLSVGACVYEGTKINLIDVPGFFDFEGEMIQALYAADAAIIVTGSSGTLTVGCEKALDYCIKNKIPAMVFINQMDKENANYKGTIDALKEKYKTKIAPVQIPVIREQKMQGYINAVEGKAYEFGSHGKTPLPIPSELNAQYEELREHLIEVAAESDEILLEKFFSGEKLTQEEITSGIKKGIANGTAIPVLAGSALMNRGVYNMMHQFIRSLPNPEEARRPKAINAKGETMEVECSKDRPFTAKVFKTVAANIGSLAVLKITSGSLKSGMTVNNTTSEKQEKISGMFVLRGKNQEPVETASAGDIVALAKLQFTKTNDTLCEQSLNIKFVAPEQPARVLAMAVYAAKQGGEEKIFAGLNRLIEEDITFEIQKNQDTGETLLVGVGETQLNVLVKKLKGRYGAEAELRTPKIAYRETIKKTVQAEGKHKKQSGGAGQYGHVKIRFEPCYEADFVFAEEVVGGTVPRQFFPAVEKGMRQAILKGVLAGYPMVNLKAVLYDGSYHDVDSKEVAYVSAANIAYKDGIPKASPVILEPIYSFRISVPGEYLGDILGDMNRRRGRILGTDNVDGRQVVTAEAPIAEMQKYATDLRSMTQGKGFYTLEFNRYEEVPAVNAQKIIAEAAKDAKDE